MVKKLVWLGLGVAVGVIAVRKLARGAEAMSPGGIADRLREKAATTAESARMFWTDAREAAQDKEFELRAAMEAGEPVDRLLADDPEDEPSPEGGVVR